MTDDMMNLRSLVEKSADEWPANKPVFKRWLDASKYLPLCRVVI